MRTVILHLAEELASVSDSPRLDAELLVRHVLQCSREYLITHPDTALNNQQLATLAELTQRRLNQEPIAYILGHQEFWSLAFKVTPAVLIPRPDTECLIEWVLQHFSQQKITCADLGTGSGAIAIALASERKQWQIHATDISQDALDIAKENAQHNQINNVAFFLGEWCGALPQNNYDLIISNPPYIAEQDAHLQSLQHEPQQALTSGESGLDDLTKIIEQAKNYLKPDGRLILEHGYDQQSQLIERLKQSGYQNIQGHNDLAQQMRFVTASMRGNRGE